MQMRQGVRETACAPDIWDSTNEGFIGFGFFAVNP